jgi:hypothetical protein
LDDMSQTSMTPIIHQSVACSVSPPHLTLVVQLVESVGDPNNVPLGSSLPTVAHQEELVLGKSAQETLKDEPLSEAAMQVWEEPLT